MHPAQTQEQKYSKVPSVRLWDSHNLFSQVFPQIEPNIILSFPMMHLLPRLATSLPLARLPEPASALWRTLFLVRLTASSAPAFLLPFPLLLLALRERVERRGQGADPAAAAAAAGERDRQKKCKTCSWGESGWRKTGRQIEETSEESRYVTAVLFWYLCIHFLISCMMNNLLFVQDRIPSFSWHWFCFLLLFLTLFFIVVVPVNLESKDSQC